MEGPATSQLAQLPSLAVERDIPGVSAPCTSASEVLLALSVGSTDLLDGLGHPATTVTTAPLLGVFTWAFMPAPFAPPLVIGVSGYYNPASTRPAPSAPLWTSPLPVLGARPPHTMFMKIFQLSRVTQGHTSWVIDSFNESRSQNLLFRTFYLGQTERFRFQIKKKDSISRPRRPPRPLHELVGPACR